MTFSLKQLSDNELQIYNKAEYQQRYTGVRLVDTSDKWILKDYESIHNEYLNIYQNSNDESIKIETLKRLIFLNWIYKVEPEYFTGIKELDESSIFSSYQILDNIIKSGKIDKELKWMLSAYSNWEYVILEYSANELDALTQFVNSVDTSIRSSPKKILSKGTMDNRGQMGMYWKPRVEKE